MFGLGERFHPLRQADGVALRGVVHVEIVADLADHHLARVEADARREADTMFALHLGGVARNRIAQVQRRVAGAARVILVRDRRAEQRHDAVAGELVDEALEALDPVGEDLEKAVHDLRPLFRVELLGQLHRALHVGEQHGDLLALALKRGARGQDLVGEMFGSVRAWRRRGGGGSSKRCTALATELGGGPVAGAAAWTGSLKWRAALFTEGRIGLILGLALGAFHRSFLIEPGGTDTP